MKPGAQQQVFDLHSILCFTGKCCSSDIVCSKVPSKSGSYGMEIMMCES